MLRVENDLLLNKSSTPAETNSKRRGFTGGKGGISALHNGQVDISQNHVSIQSAWKEWRQIANLLISSPSSASCMHTAQYGGEEWSSTVFIPWFLRNVNLRWRRHGRVTNLRKRRREKTTKMETVMTSQKVNTDWAIIIQGEKKTSDWRRNKEDLFAVYIYYT